MHTERRMAQLFLTWMFMMVKYNLRPPSASLLSRPGPLSIAIGQDEFGFGNDVCLERLLVEDNGAVTSKSHVEHALERRIFGESCAFLKADDVPRSCNVGCHCCWIALPGRSWVPREALEAVCVMKPGFIVTKWLLQRNPGPWLRERGADNCDGGEVRLHDRIFVDIPVGLALVVVVPVVTTECPKDLIGAEWSGTHNWLDATAVLVTILVCGVRRRRYSCRVNFLEAKRPGRRFHWYCTPVKWRFKYIEGRSRVEEDIGSSDRMPT